MAIVYLYLATVTAAALALWVAGTRGLRRQAATPAALPGPVEAAAA